jgi:pimeloyl-ACP methyl ester carboxylesterase
MNTPHESLTRTTFSLPLGEVHALVGGAVNARPLLFLHGFPDHPPTAVPFLEHLAETHRVVAPWLRGYAPSPIVGPYDLDTLAADALALIDRLGGQADLVGHDWGGAITYTVCAAAPSHVRRAVTLAIPHPATFLRSLASSKQWKKSWYMGLFQLPGADYLVRRRELALIDRLWRAWSPSFTLDSARRDELHACLERSLPAPLEYYRAIVRPLTTFVDRMRKAEAHIATPLLQLHGSDDGCIVPPTDEDRRLFDARVLEVVPNLGHFLHVEAPATIAARVARWLA